MNVAVRLLGLALAGTLGLPAPLPAQHIARVDRERVQSMLKGMRREIERRYFDSTFKGIDIRTAYDTADDLAASRDPVLSHALSLAGASVDPAKAGALFRKN
jgi:hypothetical protein